MALSYDMWHSTVMTCQTHGVPTLLSCTPKAAKSMMWPSLDVALP